VKEDGDGEAAPVKDSGETEHGVDVALGREREQEHVPAAPTVDGGHGWCWWWRHGFRCPSWRALVPLCVN